jgi:hypothetical protein
MYPNPSTVLPLPPRPDLQQYKTQAKDLVKACKSADPSAFRAWAARWIEGVMRLQGPSLTPVLRSWIASQLDQLEEFAKSKLSGPSPAGSKCALTSAQFVIARAHGFKSWPRFAKHIEGLAAVASPISQFEAAASAIVTGDVVSLQRLLRENPELIRARSTREHRITLLHYIGANGFEGYRQQCPGNAVEIARVLLNTGAEVDAVPKGPIGRGTPLGMVATSIHTERAAVQIPLLEILLEYGASVDGAPSGWNPLLAALHNDRPQAARFLASRGAHLDLEGAAGVGRLDVVKSFFDETGALKAVATREQLQSGFKWACEYGNKSVAEFLLDKGADLRAGENTGQTALHLAAHRGQLEIIKWLLEQGAPLEAMNVYGGTVLGQAVWSAANGDPEIDFVPVIQLLVDSGANVDAYPGLKQRVDELLSRRSKD